MFYKSKKYNFDLQEICRPLFCPSGKKPVNGRCIGLFSNIEGFTFIINFEIKFVTGQIPGLSKGFVTTIERIIFRLIGQDLNCGKCFTKLYERVNVNATMFVSIGIFSTETCSDEILLKRIRKIAENDKLYHLIRYNGKEVDFELNVMFDDVDGDDTYESLWHMKHSICKLSTHIDSSIFLQCARIVIPKEDAEALGINMALSTRNSTPLDVMPVCLDTYFLRQSSKSGACSTFLNTFIPSLIITVIKFAVINIVL
jgi:hypothetical protein